jgi:hypothetical protein
VESFQLGVLEVTMPFLSGLVATGKDLVAMLRDAVLLLMAVLLICWPQTFNNILVGAGFDEGSFAGLHWKRNLSQSDATLLKAQANMADLNAQNNGLIKLLAEARPKIGDPEIQAKIDKLIQLNTQLSSNSAKVQESVGDTISANASLVQKIQTTTGAVVTLGVVYGSDQSLSDANYEVQTIAPKLGLTNAGIYYRNDYYASVATTTDRLQAEQLLNKAKERRKDAYIVNMSTWCPITTEEAGYFKCSRP